MPTMADIFISYAAEDRPSIEPLARSLASQGWTVFWDVKLPAGQTYRDVLSKELTECKCVVVAWSKHSVNSRWVIDEAERGLELERLVPITIDGSVPPLGFGQIHAARLINWHGDISDPQYISLVPSIRHYTQAHDNPQLSQTAVSQGKAEPHDLRHIEAASQLPLKYIEAVSRLFVLFLLNILCVCLHGAIFVGIYYASSQSIWVAAGISLLVNISILSFTSIMDWSSISASGSGWLHETPLEWLFSNGLIIIIIVTVYFVDLTSDIPLLLILAFCLTFFPYSYVANYISKVKMQYASRE